MSSGETQQVPRVNVGPPKMDDDNGPLQETQQSSANFQIVRPFSLKKVEAKPDEIDGKAWVNKPVQQDEFVGEYLILKLYEDIGVPRNSFTIRFPTPEHRDKFVEALEEALKVIVGPISGDIIEFGEKVAVSVRRTESGKVEITFGQFKQVYRQDTVTALIKYINDKVQE